MERQKIFIMSILVFAFFMGALTLMYIFQDVFKTPTVNGITDTTQEFKVYIGESVNVGDGFHVRYAGDGRFYVHTSYGYWWNIDHISFNVPFKLGNFWYIVTRYELGAIVIKQVSAPY